jgi:hypothetical protein
MKTIELDHECKSCNGTGLYKGLAERDEFAVVCNTCEGTGKFHFVYRYEEFIGKKKRNDVSRVIECNPGIVIGNGVNAGGIPYKEWFAGVPFPKKSEMRKFTCPEWWYQVANYKLKPDWDECFSSFGSTFSNCKFFSTMEKCWERFDKEEIK